MREIPQQLIEFASVQPTMPKAMMWRVMILRIFPIVQAFSTCSFAQSTLVKKLSLGLRMLMAVYQILISVFLQWLRAPALRLPKRV
jgi:hypothetical protein